MLGIIIFDNITDVLYLKCDKEFVAHIKKIAVSQGLMHDDCEHDLTALDSNIIVQLFSPLVTSQRIMASEFSDPYSSFSCIDGTRCIFREYAGSLVLGIGRDDEEAIRRTVGIAIKIVELVCGPCVSLLKKSSEKRNLVSSIIETWKKLYSSEQCYLVEAVEHLIVNPDIFHASVKVLSEMMNKLSSVTKSIVPHHALLLVRNKLLAAYSSQNADLLAASDILYVNLIIEGSHLWEQELCSSSGDPERGGLLHCPKNESGSQSNGDKQRNFHVCLLLLRTSTSHFSPYFVHHRMLSEGISLAVLSEVGRTHVGAELTDFLDLLDVVSGGLTENPGFAFIEECDSLLHKASDACRSLPPDAPVGKISEALQQAVMRWETFKHSGFVDWLLSGPGTDLPSILESALSALLEAARFAWQIACLSVDQNLDRGHVVEAVSLAMDQMKPYTQYLEVKALRNMTLGCRTSLSINKYLEEFPGLVHFLYIDRKSHRLTAPSLCLEEESEKPSCSLTKTNTVTLSSVWSMVNFARSHVIKGHLSLLWKDSTFSYAYFLWFEDESGNPLKPLPLGDFKDSSIPGIMCHNFYENLCIKAFPDLSPSSIQVYELFCVHLGLATSACIVEHTRRLAATIWEVAGTNLGNQGDIP